ncbi:MAG: hypothetical protein P4N59_09585 [Negativicutes bacterium]|nr:hypothetical protein [Negativicutes bacterium]
MQIFHYDAITGKYTGVGIADRDPLTADAYLLPAFCTTAEPPTPAEGQDVIFKNGAWVMQNIPQPPPDPVPEPPTPDQIKAQLIAAVQAHLDATAQARGYDNILSAVTYADEPAVPAFQAEGQAFRAWRSQVWAFCYAQLAAVEAGSPIPTQTQLVAELPPLVLPA